MAYDLFSFYASDSPINKDTDYLQDPSLWRDSLPQPYKMIDDTIQQLIMAVFDEIELKKLTKQKQNMFKKISVVKDATLMMSFPESEMITVISTDNAHYTVACGPMGVYVGGSTDTSTVAHMTCDNITNVNVGQSRGGILFIALVIKQEIIKILAYQNHNILNICQIDRIEEKKISNIKISPNVTYLSSTLTLSTDDNNNISTVNLYTLPIDQWLQQLESAQDNSQQLFFTIPSLLFSLTPPMDSSSPISSDPIQIMKLFQDRNSSIPLANNSTLTNNYLNNRRQLFISQPHRKDFMQPDTDKTSSQQNPLIEFLFYCDGTYTPQSISTIAIVWKNTLSMLLYPLNKKVTNAGPVPSRVYCQGSYISSMTVNNDTTLICFGLQSGNIALYDIKRELLWGVQSLSLPSPVSAIQFVPTSSSNDGDLLSRQEPIVVIGGCLDGSVHCIKWTSPYQSIHSILNSGYQCNSTVKDILFISAILTIVTTVHEDGMVTVWEWLSECVPLCGLSLPSSFKHICHSDQSTATGSVECIYIIGHTQSNNTTSTTDTHLQNGVFAWNLCTCEPLRRTCINTSSSVPGISDNDNNDQMKKLIELIQQEERSDDEVTDTITRCWEKLDTLRQSRTIQAH